MLYSFFLNLQKMLGVALPFGFATPTFIIEPIFCKLTKTSHIKSGCKAARNLGKPPQGSVKQKLKGEEFQAPSADATGAWTGSYV